MNIYRTTSNKSLCQKNRVIFGRLKKQKLDKGFTLFELLAVLAVMAILGALAVPNIISWQKKARLRGAVNNLRGDLLMAKSQAIKEHTTVTIQFMTNGYTATTAGGQTFLDRDFPAGVSLNLAAAGTFLDDDGDGNPDTTFNSRGIPTPGVAGNLGSVQVQGETGSRVVSINMTGRVDAS